MNSATKERAVMGLIGVGGLAQRQHLPNLTRLTNVRLKYLCDLNQGLLETFSRKYGVAGTTTDYRQVLDDPEVQGVVIATREDQQAALTIEALNAGKHVYVEKPLANTEAECEAVCEAQRRSGKQVSVGFNRRFAPAYGKAKELIDRNGGAFAIHYRISDGSQLDHDNKKNKVRPWEYPAGTRVIYELCHIFDIMSWLAGSPIRSVYCVSGRTDEEIYALTTASGCLATLMHSSYASAEIPKERLEVVARRGALTVEQFVELRAFGLEGAEPLYRFAGHTHPEADCQHRYLLRELGTEAMFAMRRIDAEVIRRIRESVSDVNDLPELSLDRAALAADIKAEFPDKQELIDYYMGLILFSEYRFDKGWMPAMHAFAETVRTSRPCPQAAAAQDGLQASRVGHAAIRSRESGTVVRLE